MLHPDAETGRHDEQPAWLFQRHNLRVHMQRGPVGSGMVKHCSTQRFS